MPTRKRPTITWQEKSRAIQCERALLRGLAEVERDHQLQAAPECAVAESPRTRRLVTPLAQEARAWRFFSKLDGG